MKSLCHPIPFPKITFNAFLVVFLMQAAPINAETSNKSNLRPFDDKQYFAAISEYHSKSLRQDEIIRELQGNLDLSLTPIRPSRSSGSNHNFLNPSKAKTATSLIINGIYLHQQNKHQDAEIQYHAALAQYPDYAFAHFNLGLLYTDMKRFTEAEEAYKNALRIDPDYHRVHNDLGILYAKQQNYQGAKKEFWKIIKLNPKEPVARLNLAHLYYYLERNYRKAKRHYQIALKLNPELSLAKANIKKIDEDLKKSLKAEGLFEANQSVEFDFNRDWDPAKNTKDTTRQGSSPPLDKKPGKPAMQAPLF